MRFDTVADNLSPKAWETLLDELKSHYIPSFYQHEKRMHVDFGGVKDGVPGLMRAVIYFTPNTVTLDEAITILKKRDIEVLDVRENSSGL